jgi:hypothetical protein
MTYDAQALAQSNDMTPVAGRVDVAIPTAILWECFMHPDWWPRWNSCMFWVQNRHLLLGDELVWVFEPIRWGYLYKLPAHAKIVELEPKRKVTWEVTLIPGFYARHTYSTEDLGNGYTRFGTWEKAMGPTFRLLQAFWLAHFGFVKERSLGGARSLEAIYERTGNLDQQYMPPKDYAPSLLPLAAAATALIFLRDWLDESSDD